MLIVTAFVFGLASGLMLGLVSFTLGLLAAMAFVISGGIILDLSPLQIATQAIALAVSLQIGYALGLVLQALAKARRKRAFKGNAEPPKVTVTDPGSGQPR